MDRIGDIKGCDGEDCIWRLKEIMRGVNSCAIWIIYVIVMGFWIVFTFWQVLTRLGASTSTMAFNGLCIFITNYGLE